MLNPQQIQSFLEYQKQNSKSGLNDFYIEFKDLHDKKLWHQLSKKIELFIETGNFSEGDELIQLHQKFVVDFEDKINQISLVKILKVAAKQLPHSESINLLNIYAEKLKDHKEASVICKMEAASYFLPADLASCKAYIEECEKILDSLPGVEPEIHSSFYRVCADYENVRGNFVGYHKNALLYLACVPVSAIPPKERISRAIDLALASLLGNTIYNFGELIAHEILGSLKETPNSWLIDLLRAFNFGDISAFNKLLPLVNQQPLLHSHIQFLHEKIRLMCLLEIMFSRTADNRNVSFADIASKAQLEQDRVEHLLMKAMSLKLIKGVIDEVEESIKVTWVQPRVLDKKQIEEIKNSLVSWTDKVTQTVFKVESTTPELFVQ